MIDNLWKINETNHKVVDFGEEIRLKSIVCLLEGYSPFNYSIAAKTVINWLETLYMYIYYSDIMTQYDSP